jgi:hypothetical protein
MLAKFGHGIILIENATALAKAFDGDLGLVPRQWFEARSGLGFQGVLLENVWEGAERPGFWGAEAFLPASALGGCGALVQFRKNARESGMSLLLDFNPSGISQNNSLVGLRPDWMVAQTQTPEKSEGEAAWYSMEVEPGKVWTMARVKDPYFPPVLGSAQWNPCHPGMREHWKSLLARTATFCDGMYFPSAMLALPESLEKTWGNAARPVLGGACLADSPWPAVIDSARDVNPEFLALAEVYWGLEWDLMRQGFDFCLDQRLTQRLDQQDWPGLVAHLAAPRDFLGHTLHRWQGPLPGELGGKNSADFIRWNLFLATPGVKLIEAKDVAKLLETKVDGQSRAAVEPLAARTSLQVMSKVGGDWSFHLVDFPGYPAGFDGRNLGLVWSSPRPKGNSAEHVLLIANVSGENGKNELAIDLELAQSLELANGFADRKTAPGFQPHDREKCVRLTVEPQTASLSLINSSRYEGAS